MFVYFKGRNNTLFVLIFLLAYPVILMGQADNERITFEEEFKTSFRTKPKLDFKFDSRFAFFTNRGVKTIGIKFGLDYNGRFKVGLGLNRMLDSLNNRVVKNDLVIPVNLEYFYFSPYLEYVFYNSKRWALNLSTQIGIGEANYQYKNGQGKLIRLKSTLVLSYEPAMLIDYKIVRWVGIGTGIGYRLVYYKSKGITEQFSSPLFVLKLKVYLGEVVRSIRGKSALYKD